MSVKQELANLRATQKSLNLQIADISSTLEGLCAQRDSLWQRKESLEARTSSLAQTLLEKTQGEIDELNRKIFPLQNQKAELQITLEQNEKDIYERENDTSLYIQEQSKLIVSEFLEYLGKHLEDIGLEFQKNYCVMGVTEYENDRYGGCYSPTGHVGIYDKSAKTFVAQSKDFYFKNTLCTFGRGQYDELLCFSTDWYKEYRARFIPKVIEVLKENYSYGEFFSLTITDSEFTLELV